MPVNLNINTRTIIGKVKARSQLCRVYTEDGRIVITESAVLKACISDDNKVAAWLTDAVNQVQDEETGAWYQLLDERSILPVPAVTGSNINKDKESLGKTIKGIFHDSWVVDLITMNDEAKRDKQRTWWFVILGTPIILAALILGLKVLR